MLDRSSLFSKFLEPKSIASKLVTLAFALLALFWVASIDLKPSHLKLTLSSDATQSQKVEVFFLNDDKVVSAVSRQTQAAAEASAYYFKFPDHTLPNRALIDFSSVPAHWSISEVGIYSQFFLFGFDAHYWKAADLGALIKPNGALVSAGSENDILVTTHIDASRVTPNQARLKRVVLNLDYAELQASNNLLLIKGFAIACLLGIGMLLCSRYFWRLFATRRIDAAKFEIDYRQMWTNSRSSIFSGSLLFFGVMAMVVYPNFLSPGLFIEDAMEFSDFVSGMVDMTDAETYRYWRGYPVLVSELFAYAAGLFPVQMVPRLYLLISVVFLSIAVLTMAYSGVFKSPLVLLIAPLALVFGAFSEPSMYLTLTGTLFSSTALLMAIAVRPVPKRNVNLLFYCLLIIVLAFSGPYTTQMFPMAIALLVLNSSGKKSIILMLMALLAVAYILSSTSGLVQPSNLLDSGTRVTYFNTLLRMIFLLEVFPVVDSQIGIVIITLVVAALVFFRHDRVFVKHSLIFLAICLISLLTYFISSKFQQYAGMIIPPHTVISQYCWVIFVLLCLDKLFSLLRKPVVKLVLGLATVVFLCSTVVAKDRARHDRSNLRPDPSLSLFVQSIELVKKVPIGADEFIQLVYINQHDQLASALIGSKAADATAVDPSRLPAVALEFYFPISLNRSKNVVIDHIKINNALRYSDGTWVSMPD